MEAFNENTDEILAISENIARKLSGEELSNEEEKKLGDWIFSSARNRTLYNQIKDSRNFDRRNELIRQINTEGAWLRYKQKINIDPDRKRSVRWWQYAAVIFIPVLLAILLYIPQHERERNQVQVAKEQIVPGSKNAVLVLGSGKSIDLRKNDSLNIKEQDGTRIVKDDQLLCYHQPTDETNMKVPDNTLIIPRGSEYSLILSDSTKVYLNSMSKLVFPVSFSKREREVLLEGEACFMVKKDPGKPFIVNANGIRIEVLGTTFNVNAYKDQGNIVTTLVEGKVRLLAGIDQSREYILSPDDQAVFNASSGDEVQIRQVNALDYIQWIEGVYVFDQQSLGEIMQTLSRWYDFNYWFEQQDIKDIKFRGGLNKYESIEPILEIIESTGKVKATIKGKNILFSKR
ncbi:FecR family protein [Gaoshiqia sp. Z1-71]|uniref:FecR family protein n=1 Tax=Gaoshiqia hydrogeniformans TaxID=3290090 RepID=UPI003BF8CA28